MDFQLTDQQSSTVNKAVLNMDTAIKGSAGSGKTLVALAIANELSRVDQIVNHSANREVYIVTYTNSLVSFMRKQSFIENNGFKISTVHKYLIDFLRENDLVIRLTKKKERIEFINKHLDSNRYDRYFVDDEFSFIFGKGITTFEEYSNVKRSGRGKGNIDRSYIFELFKSYRNYLKKLSKVDLDDIGNYVIEFTNTNDITYIASHLIIDEVQDLSVSIIKALQKTIPGKRIYIGDVAQSIYGRDFTWKESVGKIMRPINLKLNFRNTQQIFEAADSILKFEYDMNPQKKLEVSNNITKMRELGPRPQVFFCTDKQLELINTKLKIRELIKNNYKDTIGIVYRKKTEYVKVVKKEFNSYINSGQVEIITMHSVKGLEYDHIIMIDLDDEVFFSSFYSNDEEIERRLMFVAMTRAKKTLSMFSSSDNPLRFLSEIAPNKILPVVWNAVGYEKTYRNQIIKIENNRKVLLTEFKEKTSYIEKLENLINNSSRDKIIEKENNKSLFNENELKIMDLENELKSYEQSIENLEKTIKYFNIQKHDAFKQLDIDLKDFNFRDDAKILFLGGDGGIKEKDMSGIFKNLNLGSNSFEHIKYDELANFDITQYKNTISFSDIFIGVSPHKSKNIGNTSSLVQYLLNNQEEYPRITVFKNDRGELEKFSKTNVKKHLLNSALYAYKNGL